MLIKFSHAHEVLPRSWGTFMRTRRNYESVLSQDDDSQLKMAYIKGGKPRNETSGYGENWQTDKEKNKLKLK
jgi:hypothetical protein